MRKINGFNFVEFVYWFFEILKKVMIEIYFFYIVIWI